MGKVLGYSRSRNPEVAVHSVGLSIPNETTIFQL
jgi:hypothetical protein